MSLTARMLLALATGLMAGAIATIFRGSGGGVFLSVAEPIGNAWVNALQMVVIPLVVSLLVSVVGSLPDARSTGRLGLRAFLVFAALLGATGVVSVLLGPPLVTILPIDPATTAALQGGDAAAVVGKAAHADGGGDARRDHPVEPDPCRR